MKRFTPYKTYRINNQTHYTSTGPDGSRLDSVTWLKDRLEEIRSVFLGSRSRFQFRPKQREIIESILSGNDTFAIMPTGSGKSLCFQAPAIFFPGLTLVITPLTALIVNQVDNFNANAYPLHHPQRLARNYYEGLRFRAIYPGMDGLSPQAMFAEIRRPQANNSGNPHRRRVQYKLLYVSPERLQNPKFLRALAEAERDGLRIDHVVIDEVHCMSHWGFEFRESYLHIANFISQRPLRPIISAFTATATQRDIEEIKNILGFPSQKYRSIFHFYKRKNLSLNIVKCADYPAARQETLLDILAKNIHKICIIYRTTAAGVDELYDSLQNNPLLKGRLVKYHAQMAEHEKRRSKNWFLSSIASRDMSIPQEEADSPLPHNIMIATKAFGMGIDKRDIGLIIHYDLPRSIEDYYQEVGRAGRDPEKVPRAECFLLYAVGPLTQKGTLLYTLNWIMSGLDADPGCTPIASQFSPELREEIFFWSYYRLCRIWLYCESYESPDAAHAAIIDYFQQEQTEPQVARELEDFYAYISRLCPTAGLFRSADAARLLEREQRAGQFRRELHELIGAVNELHINNTYIANLLRYHPDYYRLGQAYTLTEEQTAAGQEWKSRQNKQVKGRESLNLRPVDIRQNAAFIYIPKAADTEEYVNAAWAGRRQKPPAELIFTVSRHDIIEDVLERQEESWRLIGDQQTLVAYQRYLGRSIKGLFPKAKFSRWRHTKNNPGNIAQIPEMSSEPNQENAWDRLFAYAPGARPHTLSFTIAGEAKPSYFDMCVLDAVYSLELAGEKTVYVQTIWELLTGRNPNYSSREKLGFRQAIQASIDKMRRLTISIRDNQCPITIEEEALLPLLDKAPGQKGYAYAVLPPLCRYAEAMRGQIIRLAVSLLNTARAERATLWREDFRSSFIYNKEETAKKTGPQLAFTNNVKALPLDNEAEAALAGLLPPKAYKELAKIREHTCALRPSLGNALLCHYLLHRIAISRRKKRGNFLLFDTVRQVCGASQQEPARLFHKKIAALLCHYRRTGYLKDFYLYITDHDFRLTNGERAKGTAYFRVNDQIALKYWRLGDQGHIAVSDFDLSWLEPQQERPSKGNPQPTAELAQALQEGKKPAAETRRELAAMAIGRTEGVFFLHKLP